MELSQLSESELILIKGHFCNSYYVQCESKVQEHIKKGLDPDLAEKTIKTINMCDKVSDKPLHDIDDILFYTCVCNFKHPMMGFFLDATEAYDNGILPFKGGYSDQPAKMIEIISLIKRMQLDYNIYMHNKQNKKG